jgi:6-phosphogluconolactonase/glucosamine-6-phosphate isomerase/deaminase
VTDLLVSDKPGEAAAVIIERKLSAAVEAYGTAAVAFSGGSTPGPMFDAHSASSLPWSVNDVFQVDERVVDAHDAARNWRSLTERLLEPPGWPAARRHPMPVESTHLPAATNAYGHELREVATRGLDVVHLGLGDDGHTASWPPGDAVVNCTDDVSLVGPFRGYRRMTLTPVTVKRAAARLGLFGGRGRQRVLRGVRRGG